MNKLFIENFFDIKYNEDNQMENKWSAKLRAWCIKEKIRFLWTCNNLWHYSG